MKVIRPITVTTSMVTSNNATEEYATWSAATTYALDARVIYNYSTYESQIANNLNNTPGLDDTKWLRIGPSNWWAMFDDKTTTTTEKTATSATSVTLEATVKTGSLDSVALVNLYGDKVSVKVTDGPPGPSEQIIYPETWQSLQGNVIIDWYQYFFIDYAEQRTQAVFLGIPGLLNENIHVTFKIQSSSSTPDDLAVSVGNVVFGTQSVIGVSNYGMSAGIIDYSTKETDEYGETEFVVREYSKRITAEVTVDNKDLNKAQRTLYNLRAKPAVWIATDDPQLEEASVVYGFYRDFSTTISYPSHSMCSLEIEGLI